ncbi:MAG TPA: glycoside hydrolase family 76 protein [Mycobacterium sp.]|nr:glycoside hydrolase family 76 protein [Mycobacterium sp.]
MDEQWSNNAASAEAAIAARHFAPLWHLPATQLGVCGWPSTPNERRFGSWNYWWQAHLLDCLVDAQVRDPRPHRLHRIENQLRGHRLRNTGRWINDYYDDMAWLALAIERSGRLTGVSRPGALRALTKQFTDAWLPEYDGAIPWRKQDHFFNAPANGPAGIFLARTGELAQAQRMADWIDETLIDPETHLVFDGIKDGSMVRAQYTYCQGVVLGLETELACRTGDERHAARVRRLVAAVGDHMAPGGVLKGTGGGDGGLFAGITARYLSLVATALPGQTPDHKTARDTARELVLTSARSAWERRQTVEELPLFGADWATAARLPATDGEVGQFVGGAVSGSAVAERDLSVQLSGWMLMEAAHALTVTP